MVIEPTIRKIIKYLPIGEGLRIEWTGKLIDREYKREIQELRKRGDKDGAESKEHDRRWEERLSFDEKEAFYTNELIKKARHLRVPVPPRPKWNSEIEELEPSDDWELGHSGMWLTTTGIAKLRKDIREEEKWRREGRANWAVFLSALGGVIGTIIGFVAVFRK